MNLKTISLGITGFGAALLLFAVIMWMANKPDFYQARSICNVFGSTQSRDYQECVQSRTREGNEANSLYNSCLFSSRYPLCQSVTAVPFLSIAGIMILLGGGGLFLFGRAQRTA